MYQRHHFALRFANDGNKVSYIEKAPLRTISIKFFKDVLRYIRYGPNKHSKLKNPKPNNINIHSSNLLPGGLLFDIYNKIRIKYLAKKISSQHDIDIFITYNPRQYVLDFIDIAKPKVTAYVGVNFFLGMNRDQRPIAKEEQRFIRRVDLVFAVSKYLEEYYKRSGVKNVVRCPHGVDYNIFHQACRFSEGTSLKNIYYFGNFWYYMDTDFYNYLSKRGYNIFIVGNVAPGIHLDLNIKVIPPVTNTALPRLLYEADALLLAYKVDRRSLHVQPAKLFECFATGKPVIATNIYEFSDYKQAIYLAKTPKEAENYLRTINENNFKKIQMKQLQIAAEADWTNRFKSLETYLNRILQNK